MTVLTLDPESKTPIYLQIVQEMKTLVMTGKLHPHEQIPSVRKTAESLASSIPTPCKRPTQLLEREGILYSVTGKGDFVGG